MNLKNCRKCGRMFNYIVGDVICPGCKEANERVFQRVKNYVQENRRATMQEIVENCEVDAKQVKQWVREERLFFSDDSPVKINCESCGAQIASGRFCANCKRSTMSGLSNVSRSMQSQNISSGPETEGQKMYTFKK